MSDVEAISRAVARKEHIEWTAQDLQVLKSNYMSCGAEIPQLLNYFTETEIKDKAKLLKLRGPENPDVNLDGVILPFDEAIKLLSIYPKTVIERFGYVNATYSKQYIVDYYLKFHIRCVDGSYTRIARSFSRDQRDYIHDGGKLWDLTTYCKMHDEPPIEIINNLRYNKGLSLQAAFAYWQEHKQTYASGFSAKSLSLRVKTLNPIYSAYTGVDGERYFWAVCTECGAALLLPYEKVLSSEHGERCSVYAVPDAIALPTRMVWQVNKSTET